MSESTKSARNEVVRRTITTAVARLAVAGLAAASLMAAAVAVPATAAEAADEVTLDEVIVTAQKVDENLQDVPLAVTVLSGDTLEQQNVQVLLDIGRTTPGLTLRLGHLTPAAINIALRGQTQTDILATLDPSVGTYVDGVYWARAYGLNAELLDLKSVQILKGPQGTLYGRNTTGGAFVMESNDPDLSKLSGKASYSIGTFQEQQATFVLNAPFIEEKFGMRIAAQQTKRDGYTTNVFSGINTVNNNNAANGQKYDDRDRWQVRGKITYKPTDNFTLVASGEFFDMDDRTPARQITAGLAPYTGPATVLPIGTRLPDGTTLTAALSLANPYNVAGNATLFAGVLSGGSLANQPAAIGIGLGVLQNQVSTLASSKTVSMVNEVPYAFARTASYGLTGDLDMGWGNIKLITGWRQTKTTAGVDGDGSTFAIFFTEGKQNLTHYSGELQVTGKAVGDKLDFAAGLFYFKETGDDRAILITVPQLNPATSRFNGAIDNNSRGIYGQGTFHFSDKFSATLGLRSSNDNKGITSTNNTFNRVSGVITCSLPIPLINITTTDVAPSQCAVSRTDGFSGTSYTAGIEFRPTEDMLLYVKQSRGFRSGGQNLRAPSTTSFLPFKPEIADASEIGFKGEFLNRRLRLNFAAYSTNVKDIQRTTIVPAAPPPGSSVPVVATILSNAGKARFQGVELEFEGQVTNWLRLVASAGTVDPKYISFVDAWGDRGFERFSGVSKSQYSFGADASGTLFGNKVRLHTDYSWSADYPTDPYFYASNPSNDAIVAATTIKAVGLLSARLSTSFRDGRFEVAIYGRNLTNERGYSNNLLVAPVGFISGTRREPMTTGIVFGVNF